MDWIWIITGLAVVCLFTCIVAAVAMIKRSSNETRMEKRPGFQDVLIRGGVDIKEQKYIHEAPLFPNQDGIEAFPTVMTEDNLFQWILTLTDVGTGSHYQCRFPGRLVIGRDPAARSDENRMIVNDGGVSKTHCRIISRGDSLEIADEESKNGTFLNGKMIAGPALIRSGDSIMIGNSTFVVKIRKG